MLNEPASTIGPDTPEALDSQFRIEGEFAVRAVLRELMARHALVSLYPEGRADDALVTTIVHVDADGFELDASGQPQGAAALRNAQLVVGVALPDNIKTQFALRGLHVVHETPAVVTLRSLIPSELHRMQRRDAFRVSPPPDDAARCVRPLGDGSELACELLDLSAGGLSIRLPAGLAAPAFGEIWRHCRIEAGDRAIPCELVVRRALDDAQVPGAHRVAFAFHAPPSEVLRRIQLYVIDIEKRAIREG